jgi:hypothetical protein
MATYAAATHAAATYAAATDASLAATIASSRRSVVASALNEQIEKLPKLAFLPKFCSVRFCFTKFCFICNVLLVM